MWIPPSKILQYLPADSQDLVISIRKSDGSPVRTAQKWEVLALANAQYINGHVRGSRLTYVELTVAPNIAFAIFGEHNVGRQRRERRPTRKISALLNDANRTTVRQTLENHVVIAHHAAHCTAFGRGQEPVQKSCI